MLGEHVVSFSVGKLFSTSFACLRLNAKWNEVLEDKSSQSQPRKPVEDLIRISLESENAFSGLGSNWQK